MYPNIRPHLLWEYDFSTFDFDKGAAIVVERVVERGTLKDWQEMIRFYGKYKVSHFANRSKQLSKRDKSFTNLFIHSDFLNYAISKP